MTHHVSHWYTGRKVDIEHNVYDHADRTLCGLKIGDESDGLRNFQRRAYVRTLIDDGTVPSRSWAEVVADLLPRLNASGRAAFDASDHRLHDKIVLCTDCRAERRKIIGW